MLNLLVVKIDGFEQEIWERVYLHSCHNPQLAIKLANEAVMTFRENQPGLWIPKMSAVKGFKRNS